MWVLRVNETELPLFRHVSSRVKPACLCPPSCEDVPGKSTVSSTGRHHQLDSRPVPAVCPPALMYHPWERPRRVEDKQQLRFL